MKDPSLGEQDTQRHHVRALRFATEIEVTNSLQRTYMYSKYVLLHAIRYGYIKHFKRNLLLCPILDITYVIHCFKCMKNSGSPTVYVKSISLVLQSTKNNYNIRECTIIRI